MKMSIRRGLSRILLERRMYHVRVTFLLRSRGVSVTYLYSYGISLSYVRRINAYVIRTCDVCMAYVLRSILICGVSVLYQFFFNAYENKRLCSLCSCNSLIIVIKYEPPHGKNQQSAKAKTKAPISFALTAELISAFIFSTWIVQYYNSSTF